MKKIVMLAVLLISTANFAQTKAKSKGKKVVKKETTVNATETPKKAEEVKVVEEDKSLIKKVNNTAKTIEDKANLPLINEIKSVKKVKDGAVKVKEITN